MKIPDLDENDIFFFSQSWRELKVADLMKLQFTRLQVDKLLSLNYLL